MKKYQKPEIAFENFEMATSLAAGCTIIVPDGITDANITDSLFEYNGVFYFLNGHTCKGGVHTGAAGTVLDEIRLSGWNS